MKNNLKKSIAFLGIAAMAAPLIGAVKPNTANALNSSAAVRQMTASTRAQEEATILLKQVAADARTTAEHAAKLEAFARGRQVSFHAHGYELNRARIAINAMGTTLSRLQALRSETLPWQQLLIDRLQPMLAGLAGHATEAIQSFSADRGRLHSQEYRDAIGSMSDYADQVRNVISANIDYAKASERLNRVDGGNMQIES